MSEVSADRNLAAEVRAVEAGHRAYRQPEGWYKVTSETYEGWGKWYRVDWVGMREGDAIYFVCQPDGNWAYRNDHLVRSEQPGVAGCMHAALVARSLERAGLAYFDGHCWRVTAKGQQTTFADDAPDNVFDLFPRL